MDREGIHRRELLYQDLDWLEASTPHSHSLTRFQFSLDSIGSLCVSAKREDVR
jgi:hypothetical protein